jgi:hypothetical protein
MQTYWVLPAMIDASARLAQGEFRHDTADVTSEGRVGRTVGGHGERRRCRYQGSG